MTKASITHAIVLAAGLGKRMYPLTLEKPKPLIEVAGKPLIDYALDLLGRQGIKQAVVNTHYLAPMLQAHLAQRSQDPKVMISPEDLLLETGGGIKQALPLIGDTSFFSLNSDTICVDNRDKIAALTRMAEAWNEQEMDFLLLLHPRDKAIGYEGTGDFFWDGHVVRRRMGSEIAPYVFTGVQIMHPRIFADSPDGAFSMNLLYDRHKEADGSLARVKAIIHEGDWLHVGDPDALSLAEAYFSKH